MDFSLRCNSLTCRTVLDDRAVVTTCSHVFCLDCSDSLNLSNADINKRNCPACATLLNNQDDAVVAQLNPSEDYKTSVLSGLSPTLIMECAGRGLSFYSYQTTQEIVYQEFLARSLTDKYSTLSTEMDKVIHDANAEVATLRDKLSAVYEERKSLENKNQELANAFKEKSKHQQQLQKLYQSLKQQQLAAGMEMAAEHDAEHVLRAAGLEQHGGNSNHRGGQPMYSRARSNGSNGSGARSRTINGWEQQQQQIQNQNHARLQSARSMPGHNVPMTPGGNRHRQPLNGAGTTMKPGMGGTFQQPSPFRQPLNSIDPNVYGNTNNAGYGMSAGMKVGREQSGILSRSGYAAPRPGVSGLHMR